MKTAELDRLSEGEKHNNLLQRVQSDSESVQLFHILCVSASIALLFKHSYMALVTAAAAALAVRLFCFGLGYGEEKEKGVLELWVNMNKRCFTSFLKMHSFNSFISCYSASATLVTVASNRLHTVIAAVHRSPTRLLLFFF